jgi:hypothetical protein
MGLAFLTCRVNCGHMKNKIMFVVLVALTATFVFSGICFAEESHSVVNCNDPNLGFWDWLACQISGATDLPSLP